MRHSCWRQSSLRELSRRVVVAVHTSPSACGLTRACLSSQEKRNALDELDRQAILLGRELEDKERALRARVLCQCELTRRCPV